MEEWAPGENLTPFLNRFLILWMLCQNGEHATGLDENNLSPHTQPNRTSI
jgi:hypothetical protein